MNAPANRSGAVRNLLRSVTSRLNRERHAPVFDRFVRRAGGLFALAVLAFLAGWTLPELPVADDAPKYPAERCLVVVGVARFSVPGTAGAAPLMLVQTAWLEGESPLAASSVHAAICDASERVLPIPPIANLLFRREGPVFVPSALPTIPMRSFLPPSGFRLHTAGPAPAPLAPEQT